MMHKDSHKNKVKGTQSVTSRGTVIQLSNSDQPDAQVCSSLDKFVQVCKSKYVPAKSGTIRGGTASSVPASRSSADAGIWTSLVAALELSQQLSSAHSALKLISLLLFCHLNPTQVALVYKHVCSRDNCCLSMLTACNVSSVCLCLNLFGVACDSSNVRHALRSKMSDLV